MQFHSSSRIQIITAASQTTQHHIALVDNGHVAAGHLDLRTNSFHHTGSFLLEDQTAGGSANFSSSTVIVVDTSLSGISIFTTKASPRIGVRQGVGPFRAGYASPPARQGSTR